jgi:uncharacterized membrane protein YbhN (UPF0104 family)
MLWLRIVVSLALIAVLVRKEPDLGSAFPSGFGGVTIMLLVVAVLMAFVGVVLSAWRWQRAIALFREPPSVASLTMQYLAGLFVGNVLPSTIGGDVLRVSRASEELGSEVAFASVALERLTGFVALPLLVVAGILLRPSTLSADHAWLSLLIASAALALLATILYLAGHPRAAGRYVDRTNWLRFVGAVHVGVAALRRSPRKSLGIVGTALAYQVSVLVSVLIIARALEIPVPVAGLIAFVPAVAMVQVVPISLNGLGVREGMLVLLLTPLGATRGQAIALGLLWAGSVLVVSGLGAPAFAAGRRKASAATSESDADKGAA